MKTILVVDDMPIIRDPIAATLSAAGYDALCAGNGKQALEMLRAQHVDLILLDVTMPVMDGMAFLRVIRGDPKTTETPVIMLSSAEERQDVLQAAKLGIQGYILKSHFSLKDLLARVTRHISGTPPVTAPVAQQSRAPASSPNPSTHGGAITADISPPNAAQSIARPTAAVPSPCGAPCVSDEIPSLITREQCIERARKALHGQTLSGAVAEVISLAASPRSNSSDLSAMIARDPLLSARVLQVANSSSFASRHGIVSTLAEAVRNIGCTAVRNIAGALGVFNAMPASDSDGRNPLRCWQHAFAVATLCNHLATRDDSGVAYLVGLCHELGEILFHSHFADEYRQVQEIHEKTGRPRDELEKVMLGMSHCEVLRTIVKCLELPNAISEPIQEYHAKGLGSSEGSPVTRLLRVADLYANGMLLGSSNQSPIRPITCADAKSITGHNNPPPLDRVAMRGEILGLTATLSRFSQKQQAEVMTAPYPQRRVRVWLARDPALSSLDPLESALELLAEVTPHKALPGAHEAAGYQAIVAVAHNTSVLGFTAADVKAAATRPNGEALPILWLVGHIDGEQSGAAPSAWPIPLAKLAEFIGAIPIT
jgi:two-component system chemotaxis response regulator CheY